MQENTSGTPVDNRRAIVDRFQIGDVWYARLTTGEVRRQQTKPRGKAARRKDKLARKRARV